MTIWLCSVTTSTNATATISFWGNGAAIYGAVSRNHGPFTVSLDGAPEINLDGASYGFLPQTLLVISTPRCILAHALMLCLQFHFSGLPTGMHSIVVKHTATNGSISTDLDYVMVYQCGSYVCVIFSFGISIFSPVFALVLLVLVCIILLAKPMLGQLLAVLWEE
jgi:hypothetical protein